MFHLFSILSAWSKSRSWNIFNSLHYVSGYIHILYKNWNRATPLNYFSGPVKHVHHKTFAAWLVWILGIVDLCDNCFEPFYSFSFDFINHIGLLSSLIMPANISWFLLGIAYIMGASTLFMSVFCLYSILSRRWLSVSSSSLSHLPEVKYEDGNNSVEKYKSHMKPLLHEGYIKVWKWNIRWLKV